MKQHKIGRMAALAILTAVLANGAAMGRELTPGVYREYALSTRIGDDWRVTDPGVDRPDAQVFLPNAVFTLSGVDLTNAVRAELTMHHWAGHSNTEGQQVIINGEHHLDVPVNENFNTPIPPQLYLNDDNPVLDVPLEWLQNGDNTIQGTIAEELQGAHWWGQWGWYFIALRVWIDEEATDMPGGSLVLETTGKVIGGESVELRFEADGEGVNLVKYFAKYMGFDEDGDGFIYDWHGFDESYTAGGGSITTQGHVGTSSAEETSFPETWNVEWLPDQQPGAISFTAVIRRGENEYRVLEPVHGYSLQRDYSVKLAVPDNWTFALVRNGVSGGASPYIPVEHPVEEVSAARILMRTWNGSSNEHGNTPMKVNGSEYQEGIITGASHYYALDDKPLPLDVFTLQPGKNRIDFRTETVHHGCEVLAPGPCLLLRWEEPQPDYLTVEPVVDGWYVGATHWVYYMQANAPWLWSAQLDWIYSYEPHETAGWHFSPVFGYFYTLRGAYPAVYLFETGSWAYFSGQDAETIRFVDYLSGAEVVFERP